jgi:hypothetical protein
MTLTVRRAWLQKHPSPVATAGEFHWYPREVDGDLRAELVARAHGIEPPAILWELSPGRVVWARVFAAHAPTDGRRYVGLALAIAQGEAAPSELLAAIDEPTAAPWSPELAIAEGIDAAGRSAQRPVADGIDAALLAVVEGASDPADLDRAVIARGLISGGLRRSALAEPRIAMVAVECAMPATLTGTTRRGGWLLDAASNPEPDVVAELAAAAVAEPLSAAARGWAVLGELATARQLSLDAAWRDAIRAPSAWLSEEELAAWAGGALPASWLATRPQPEQLGLVDMLHLWGRGRFDLCPTAGTVIERLADAVASRVLAQLADGRDAADAIAEARWYSVLPAGRRDALRETLVDRVPSLAAAWPLEIRERRLGATHA